MCALAADFGEICELKIACRKNVIFIFQTLYYAFNKNLCYLVPKNAVQFGHVTTIAPSNAPDIFISTKSILLFDHWPSIHKYL